MTGRYLRRCDLCGGTSRAALTVCEGCDQVIALTKENERLRAEVESLRALVARHETVRVTR